jgi:exopolyphosphatase/guanosine-5'-triphosphate,3'-diphosphate pyrophosphatase
MAHQTVPAPATRVPAGDISSRPQPPGFVSRRTYAALDLGTNNCRLLIARPSTNGFVVIDAFSRIVRLGEGLAVTGRLSEAAMDRAVKALAICADKLCRRRVSLVRSVATEACRRAENGDAFVRRVHAETGIALDIISPEQEARLAVMGCHVLLEPGDGVALIFDIGGGSTELALIETGRPHPRVIDWFSIPLGVVSLTEIEPHDFASRDERLAAYRRMRAHVAANFAGFAASIATHRAKPYRLLGASGTVTTLASVHLGLPSSDRRKIDGLVVPADAIRTITGQISGMSVPERMEIPCIGQERADLVVAGCAILEEILTLWPAERLGIADSGIREGILRLLMARELERL